MYGDFTKQQLCDKLLEVLQMTRCGCDIAKITYLPQLEVVQIEYAGGAVYRANVACDSGTSMIKDIIKVIV